MPTNTLLKTLFEYKCWANDDLYRLLATLPEATHARERHDAIRILNHVHVVDRIFQANVQARPHSFTSLNTPETPELPALREAVAATDRWYLGYVTTLDESDLGELIDFSFVDGSPGRMSRVEMLMHVLTHGNYHRGAAGRILFQAGLTLPKDSLTVFMHQPQRLTA
jgi:uncharacterized damage-inducible protein DinB